MQERFWAFREDVQKKLNWLTIAAFTIGTFGQSIQALAAPQNFARPGAGISRMPIEVMAFNAPGFGEVSDAINLANGNVFVSADSVARNNLLTAGTDETTSLFGSNWNMTPRLRLSMTPAFSNNLNSVSGMPSTLTILSGEGSSQVFQKLDQELKTEQIWNPATQQNVPKSVLTHKWSTDPILLSAPHWIKRYSGYNKATYENNFGTVIYRNQPRVGTKYSDEYVVVVVKPWGNTVAHYYDHSGTRYSFQYGGVYPDRIQTLDQQYRGAAMIDTYGITGLEEGEGNAPNTAPRTDIWYATYGSGRIAAVQDEYKRRTYYEWNADNTLKAIYMLATTAYTVPINYTGAGGAKETARRMVEFTYKDVGSPAVKAISTIKFSAYSGLGGNWNFSTGSNVISRTFEFDYTPQNGRILLSGIRRPILGGSKFIETRYGYDTTGTWADRLKWVRTIGGSYTSMTPIADGSRPKTYETADAEPQINYTYTTISGTRTATPVDQPVAIPATPPAGLSKTLAEGMGTPSVSATVLYGNDEAVQYTLPSTLISGMYTVKVMARGWNYLGWPRVALRLNGSNVGYADITSNAYPTSAATGYAKGVAGYNFGQFYLNSNGKLDIAFINDACCGPTAPNGALNNDDRNVVVDYIYLEPVGTTGTTTKVNMVQGSGNTRKESEYHFDTSGQMVQQRVWDYNPWQAANSFAGGAGATGRWLETAYSYYADGNTKSVTSPTGSRSEYEYDTRGNITFQRAFQSGETVAERTIQTYYNHTEDPNLPSEIARSGRFESTRGGVAYNTSGPQELMSYFYENNKGPSYGDLGTQTFKMVNRKYTLTRVLDSNFLYQDRNQNEKFDTKGRMYERSDDFSTTTYTYWDSVAASSQVASSRGVYHNGSGLADWTTARNIPQFGDFLRTQTGLDGSKYFEYDELGNLVYQRHDAAFVADYNGATPVTRNLEMLAAVNGFGQQTWKYIFHNPGSGAYIDYSKQVTAYLPTGEPDFSWAGNQNNITDYIYNSSGVNLARLSSIRSGNGTYTNGVPSISRTKQLQGYVSYDTYGRLLAKQVDGFATTYLYDTLNRQVQVTAPSTMLDQGMVYGFAGKPTYQYEKSKDLTKNTTTEKGQTTRYDSLGRATSTTFDNMGGALAHTISSTYDPFDRPIRIIDGRLNQIGASDDDRSTYTWYNSWGEVEAQAGPTLRGASGAGYTDLKRPWVYNSFDGSGRKTKERRLVGSKSGSGSMSITGGGNFSPNLGNEQNFLTTDIEYDNLQRPKKSTVTSNYRYVTNTASWSPVRYVTNIAYDNLSNVISQQQDLCESSQPDCSSQHDSTVVTARMAYDGAGRATKTWSPRSVNDIATNGANATINPTIKTYDLLGNVTSETDARGITTKLYSYTNDGLLIEVREPDNSSSTVTGAVNLQQIETDTAYAAQIAAGFKTTKMLVYGSRQFPTTICSANSTSQATGGTCIDYTYDYAGRTLETTVPGQTEKVIQVYDGRGNQTSITDADGFVTENTYDWLGRMTKDWKKARAASIDSTAGLTNGLETNYEYDYVGNLTKKIVGTGTQALTTDYAYNSQGKVIRESRPYTTAAPAGERNFINRTYRVDGGLTAETTHDFDGAMGTVVSGTVPSMTRGNLTFYELNLLGHRIAETRYDNQGAGNAHFAATYYTNALGKMYRRDFRGRSSIYQNWRIKDTSLSATTDGNYTGITNYKTYWKYDPEGLLLQYYEQPTDTGWNNLGSQQNYYTYTYSPTSKELTNYRNVWSSARSSLNPTSGGFEKGVSLAASIGTTTSTYNERDQLATATTNDAAVNGYRSTAIYATPNTTTTYKYNVDGSKYRAEVGSQYSEFSYDTRGRVTSVYDSNGNTTTGGSLGASTATTIYERGKKTEAVLPSSGGCEYRMITEYTVGGLPYRSQEWKDKTTCTNNYLPTKIERVYNTRGQLASSKTWRSSFEVNIDPKTPWDYAPVYDTTVTYNSFGVEVNNSTAQTRYYTEPGYYGDLTTTQTTVQVPQQFTNSITQKSYSTSYNLVGTRTWVIEFEQYSEPFNGVPPQIQQIPNSNYTSTYTLDPAGNRTYVSTTNRPAEDKRTKRYNADGKAVEFNITTQTSAGHWWWRSYGKNLTFDLFFYDPKGNQTLSATVDVWERDDNGERNVSRRTYANIYSGDEVVTIRKKSGNNPTNYDNNNTYKDETFTLVDGMRDEEWALAAPYQVRPPADSPQTFQAPITQKNQVLLLNPLNVQPSSAQAPAQASTPTDAKPPTAVVPPTDTSRPVSPTPPSQTVGQGQTAGTVQNLGTVATPQGTAGTKPQSGSASSSSTSQTPATSLATPSAAQANKDASGIQFQPPQRSALPASIDSVSPQNTAAPSSVTSNPVVGNSNPGGVQAPNQAKPPQANINPQAGPLGVVAPASIAKPNVPPVTADNNPVGVIAPVGGGGQDVKPQGIVDDFLKWLVDEVAKAKSLNDAEAVQLREQARQTGNEERIAAVELQLAARERARALGESAMKDFKTVAAGAQYLPPGEQVTLWQKVMLNDYLYRVAGPTKGTPGGDQAVRDMLNQMASNVLRVKQSNRQMERADQFWSGVNGDFSLTHDQNRQGYESIRSLNRGIPAFRIKQGIDGQAAQRGWNEWWGATDWKLVGITAAGAVVLVGAGYVLVIYGAAAAGTGGTATFFLVQNSQGASRLLNGGAPWPTAPNKSNLGEGLYVWNNLDDALAYFSKLQAGGAQNLLMLEARISQSALSKLRTMDLTKVSDDEANVWLDRFAKLNGGIPNHGYERVIRGAGLADENYFSKDVFNLFKIIVR